MSLLSILSIATNALLNTQAQINVVSQNIGNAQNPNYSQRNTDVIDRSQQNGGGNQIVDVQRAVDGTLQTNYLNQLTSAGSSSTVNQLYTQLEQLTGSSTSAPILSSALQAFQNAWQALQATPEDTTTQQQVINSAQALVSTIQTIAHGVEQIATQTTTQLGQDVGTLNSSLSQIAKLNAQIVSGKRAGQDMSSAEDSRDQLIATVASLVPVQQQVNDDGSIYLSTPTGVSLVQQSATSFAYDGTSDTLYSANDAAKTPLNGAFGNGQIGAEIGILATGGSANSSTPGVGALDKIRSQLNGLVDLFYASPPATPTAFQAAYDGATPANAGEQDTSFFTMSGTSGSPSDRFDLEVNPALLDGTATVKESSATAVAAQMTATTNSFSAGGVTTGPTSYLGIVNAIISDQSSAASQATANESAATANTSAAQQAYRNVTGVSSDQQLAQLVALQNAYSAAAKIISTVQELESTLLTAVNAT